jgi:hypothetical protein
MLATFTSTALKLIIIIIIIIIIEILITSSSLLLPQPPRLVCLAVPCVLPFSSTCTYLIYPVLLNRFPLFNSTFASRLLCSAILPRYLGTTQRSYVLIKILR